MTSECPDFASVSTPLQTRLAGLGYASECRCGVCLSDAKSLSAYAAPRPRVMALSASDQVNQAGRKCATLCVRTTPHSGQRTYGTSGGEMT